MKELTQNKINRIAKYNKLISDLHNKLEKKGGFTGNELNNFIKKYKCSSTTVLMLRNSGIIKKGNDKLYHWNTIKPIPAMGKKILDNLGTYNKQYWKTKRSRSKENFKVETKVTKKKVKLPSLHPSHTTPTTVDKTALVKSKYISILWGVYVKKVYY